ncbi:hypothetical protein QQ045_012900 [Rhodiola kirilowii]
MDSSQGGDGADKKLAWGLAGSLGASGSGNYAVDNSYFVSDGYSVMGTDSWPALSKKWPSPAISLGASVQDVIGLKQNYNPNYEHGSSSKSTSPNLIPHVNNNQAEWSSHVRNNRLNLPSGGNSSYQYDRHRSIDHDVPPARFYRYQEQRNYNLFRGSWPPSDTSYTPGFFNYSMPPPGFNIQFPFESHPYSPPHVSPSICVPPRPPILRPLTPMFRPPVDPLPGPQGLYRPAAFDRPPPPPPLAFWIQKQIEYYFSNENLVKDVFLRRHMNAEGWVPMEVVANFPLVKRFATNTKFENINNIFELMQNSLTLEVKDGKIRRRVDWKRWLLPQVLVALVQPVNEKHEQAVTSQPVNEK